MTGGGGIIISNKVEKIKGAKKHEHEDIDDSCARRAADRGYEPDRIAIDALAG